MNLNFIRKNKLLLLFVFFLSIGLVGCNMNSSSSIYTKGTANTNDDTTNDPITTDSQPNILLIVVDDMGWTDLGCYGSEIKTPNIDALAKRGVQFTNFHTSVSCSPTRSMLLTGTDNHYAGLGNMKELRSKNQIGKDGYEGYLNDKVDCIAEILHSANYNTYMAGKWHLGHETIDQTPIGKGFDRAFGLLNGGASHYTSAYGLTAEDQIKYIVNGKICIKDENLSLPSNFYSTTSYGDSIINYIVSGKKDNPDKPFFAYLAFSAPHDPMHVDPMYSEPYKGIYDDGYDALRKRRIHSIAQKKLIHGFNEKKINRLLKNDTCLQVKVRPWEMLTKEAKAKETKSMEVYAGMVACVDYKIGQVIQTLKLLDELDNTLIVFLSDNGSNPWYSEDYPDSRGPSAQKQYIDGFDNSVKNIGLDHSHRAYGIGWATACAGPFSYYKMTVGEGGIRTPLIIAGVGVESKKTDAFAYVTDIVPTIMHYANVEATDNYMNYPILGKKLTKLLSGVKQYVYLNTDIICGEMGGGKWVKQGNYKASSVANPYGDETWHLYNIKDDLCESELLATMPEIKENKSNDDDNKQLKKMIQAYSNYANKVGVIEPNSKQSRIVAYK